MYVVWHDLKALDLNAKLISLLIETFAESLFDFLHQHFAGTSGKR
jgi:hypothetical protein